MGHLNGILARVGGNLNNNFPKSQMPGGLPGGGMLKLRFDRYINLLTLSSIQRQAYILDVHVHCTTSETSYSVKISIAWATQLRRLIV